MQQHISFERLKEEHRTHQFSEITAIRQRHDWADSLDENWGIKCELEDLVTQVT